MSARRAWWHTGSSLAVAALGTVLVILGWWVFTMEPDGGWWRGWAAGAWTLQAVIIYGLSGLIRLRQGEPLRSRDGYGSWLHLWEFRARLTHPALLARCRVSDP